VKKIEKIIRKVLREEFDPKRYILRRMESGELERELEYALDYMSKGLRKSRMMRKDMSYNTYKNIVTSMIITPLEQSLIQSGDFESIQKLTEYIYEIYKCRIKQ